MKSEVIVLDLMMKNEAKHSDVIDIMSRMQEYLGHDYPSDRRVPSGGDQLTCEQQVGAQRHTMDGDTVEDQLGQLEPVTEDWYCLVCLLSVRVETCVWFVCGVCMCRCVICNLKRLYCGF